MCLRKFKSRFVHSPTEIKWFFETIKAKAMRPLETEHHCCNKLLLLLDRLHNCLSAEQMSDKYHIGCKTAYDHCSDIVHAILRTYGEDKNVITFPTKPERKIMVDILKRKNMPCPSALFAVDGSDTRCTGRHIMERLSHKYKWLPCFKVSYSPMHQMIHLPLNKSGNILRRKSVWQCVRCQHRARIHHSRPQNTAGSCLVPRHCQDDGRICDPRGQRSVQCFSFCF